jgi:glycosyltransferase involved in cell wall biosynthesis
MSAFDGKRVMLLSSIGSSTGYGNDGINLAMELIERGADLHVNPGEVGIPIPAPVAQLFTKQRPVDFDVVIQHSDPGQLAMPPLLARITKTSVAWSMWEFTGFGGEKFEEHMKIRMENFQHVLAYDDTSKAALQPYWAGEIGTLQGGYRADNWKVRPEDTQRDWDGTFKFLMLGALGLRKNPFAAIEAFGQLKAEHGKDFDAQLHIKNNLGNLHPAIQQAYPGVRIHTDVWSHKQMREFYLSGHCLVAPSWGEGKNLPALEAQTMGIPALVSDCGGHRQWNFQPELLVPGTMAEHDPIRKPGQESVRVDVAALRDKMWSLYSDRAHTRELGSQAAATIPAMCDWGRVVDRLETRLF